MRLTEKQVSFILMSVIDKKDWWRERYATILDCMNGIVVAESGCDPNAVRYEPHYRYVLRQSSKPVHCTIDTEENLQKISWGLCQIMGGTARAVGYKGWLTELLVPETNLLWGVTYFYRLGEKFGWDYPSDLVSAWNQGSPRRTERGVYQNQPYVNLVLNIIDRQREGYNGKGERDAETPEDSEGKTVS